MSTFFEPSFYNSFLSSPLAVNGSETEVFVNTLKTLTGETIAGVPSYASQGYIIVDPLAQFGTQPEIISYTGLDTTGIGFTGITRGLSSVTTGSVTANKTYHGTGTPVIISWGAQDINDVITYVNSLVSGANGNASSTVAGVTKLSQDPASPTVPIAVGVNTSLSGTAISTTNKAVDQLTLSPYTYGYAVDTGSANTYAVALSPAPTAYTSGMAVKFKATNANTTTSTLNVNTLGAITIKKNVSSNLSANDILASQEVHVIYDGTNFQMVSPISNGFIGIVGSGATTHTLSSSTTTTIAHGLGVVPKIARVTAMVALASNSSTIAMAVITGGTTSSINIDWDNGTGTTGATNNVFRLIDSQAGGSGATGTLTVDATNISISWSSITGSPSSVVQLIWDVLA